MQEADEQQHVAEPRLVILTVKTTAGTSRDITETEELLRKIPPYAQALDLAISKNSNGQRLCIEDSEARDYLILLDAIDYLRNGYLRVISGDLATCKAHLQGLKKLKVMSRSLEVPKLDQATIDHALTWTITHPDQFARFAIHCCKKGYMDGIRRDATKCRLIQRRLELNVTTLRGTEVAKEILNMGGPLSKLYREVIEAWYNNPH